ncbi:MAG: FAD-binding oxidoreductase [Planctomycetia bacterium]|nr:FAD-binding oxidoreductase [Planctomycetia bacterium]
MHKRAEIVVIGAGIAGASIALHLARLGRPDVLVLDQGELVSGTTSHAPGLIGQLRSSASLTRILMASVALYRGLSVDGVPGFDQVGSLRLASSDERLAELRRQRDFARRCGLEAHLLSSGEALERFPLMEARGVRGALFMPTDGSATATVLAQAMIRDARALGASFVPGTRVTGIDVAQGAVHGVQTEGGRVETQTLVIASGIWSPAIGRMCGVPIPLVPMEHQYIETEPLAALAGRTVANLRDPDNLVYLRQKGTSLILGGYERDPRSFLTALPRTENPTVRPFDRAHFAALVRAAETRVPLLAHCQVAREVTGLESFTPDGAFLLGPAPAVRGVWVACGFCAHGVSGAGGVGQALAEWIVSGRPQLDLAAMSLVRFAGQALDEQAIARLASGVYSTYYDITAATAGTGAT